MVGQIEPKKQVPSPWSKDCALLNNECIRHMYLEAKRKWQRESSGDVAEDVEKTLFDEIAESVFQWWPEAKSARAELKGVAKANSQRSRCQSWFACWMLQGGVRSACRGWALTY